MNAPKRGQCKYFCNTSFRMIGAKMIRFIQAIAPGSGSTIFCELAVISPVLRSTWQLNAANCFVSEPS
jgi:hypothetical protein